MITMAAEVEQEVVEGTFTMRMDSDVLMMAETAAGNMGMSLQQIVRNLLLRIAYDKTVPFKIQVPKHLPE
jgi:antitoxin component of RelBE/YafQ-DinJ toxin-antitoxin module